MVEEASEFLKDLRLAVTERVTSPLVGTYWISWFIWNFKFVLIVFSGEAIESKLQLIHDEMFWSFLGYIWTYGGPAVMTALFIFAYPRPAEIVYQYRLKYQQKLNAIRQKEENEQLLSAEDVRQHRLEMREKERKIKQSLDEMEKEVADLRRENEALKSRSSQNLTVLKSSGNLEDQDQRDQYLGDYNFIDEIEDLGALEVGIMTVISSHFPDAVSQDPLLKNIGDLKFPPATSKSRIKIMSSIDFLVNNQFIEKGVGYEGEPTYSLTQKGRKFALKHDL